MNHCYNNKKKPELNLIQNACIACAVVFFFNQEGKFCSLRVLSGVKINTVTPPTKNECTQVGHVIQASFHISAAFFFLPKYHFPKDYRLLLYYIAILSY